MEQTGDFLFEANIEEMNEDWGIEEMNELIKNVTNCFNSHTGGFIPPFIHYNRSS